MPRLVRDPKDFWSGVLFVAAGLAAVVLIRQHSMGTATRMGPAYFPAILGGLLALLGLAAVVRSLVVRGARVGSLALGKVAFVLGSNVLFGVLLRGLGLGPALVALVLVSAYASQRFSWGAATILAVGLAVFGVVVFVKALGLPMPVVGPWLGG